MAEPQTQPSNAQQAQPRQQREQKPENVVYVGSKPPMDYVLALISQFNNGTPDVILKARGRAISSAVDVSQIAMRKFLPDVKVKSIEISTEKVTSEDGRPLNVSSIAIHLTK